VSRLPARMVAVVVAATATAGICTPPASAGTPNVAPVVAFAQAQVGKPYIYGSNGPSSWDCSSLVQHAYAAAGIALPRVTTDQIGAAGWVSPSALQPGDLVFRSGSEAEKPGHVGMYVGGGQVVEAKGAAWGTIVTPLAQWHAQTAIRPGTPGVNDYIDRAATRTGVPRDLLRALLWQESGFDPTISSPAGAVGIAQFMPTTWATRGEDGDNDGRKDPLDPADAIPAMADMIADLIRANGGDIGLALAGYNAGQGAVNRYHGVPPFPETQNYVRNILASAALRDSHIDLHPAPAPAPPISTQIAAAAVDVVAIPALPRTPTDWVHDLAVGAATVALGLWLLRLFAPAIYTAWTARVRSRSRRAATAVRSKVAGSARLRPTVQAAERHADRARPSLRRARANIRNTRRGTAFVRTTVAVSARNRRRPAPGSALRFVKPAGSATGSATYSRPTGPTPASAAPFTVEAVAVIADLLRMLRTRLFGSATPRIVAEPSAPHSATGSATWGRPHAYAPPPSAPVADSAPSAPHPAAGSATTSATSPQPASNPARSTAMAVAHPYNLNWREHLQDPGFEALLKAAKGIQDVDLSKGEKVAALYMWTTEFLTVVADGIGYAADEAARRGLAKPVHSAVSLSADLITNAATSALRAEKNLFELHDTFFTTDLSKDTQRIGT